jgi:innexin
VTLCDFHIREVGIVHRYTVQCVLPINLFNEKIFLILWFWILLLTAFNIGDFVSWLLRIVSVDSRSAYVRRKLSMSGACDNRFDQHSFNAEQNKLNAQRMSKAFVRDYLQADGCFALRLLARNGQDIIVGKIIDQLYAHFCTHYQGNHVNSDRGMARSADASHNSYHNSSYAHVVSQMQPVEIPVQHDEQRPLVPRLAQ